MDLKKVSREFLKWEYENKLYEIKVNNISLYTFIRMEVYESLMFNSSLSSIFEKEDRKQVKRINYIKIIKSSLGFLLKQNRLKNTNLYITNTENKIKLKDVYVDNFFDKLIKRDSGKAAILEFPNVINYHFKDIQNKDKTIKAGFLYVAEKLFKAKINTKEIDECIAKISKLYTELYSSLYEKKYDEIDLENLIKNRVLRNLRRVHIYEKFLRYYKPNIVYLKSAYSPLMQIFVHVCKKHNVKVVEVQHGHIYPYHIGYLLPIDVDNSKELFPDEVYVWSDYYKSTLLKNKWNECNISKVGDFTYNNEVSVQKDLSNGEVVSLKSKYKKIITIISQHTLLNEIDEFLEGIEKLPKDTVVLIKLHPRLILSQEEVFSKKALKNENLIIIKEGNIKSYLKISDLVIGVYSTAVIEALEMNKTVHLININVAHFFDDFIQSSIVQKTDNILESFNKFKEQTEKVEVVFREPFYS